MEVDFVQNAPDFPILRMPFVHIYCHNCVRVLLCACWTIDSKMLCTVRICIILSIVHWQSNVTGCATHTFGWLFISFTKIVYCYFSWLHVAVCWSSDCSLSLLSSIVCLCFVLFYNFTGFTLDIYSVTNYC